jgi:hypothetical protein
MKTNSEINISGTVYSIKSLPNPKKFEVILRVTNKTRNMIVSNLDTNIDADSDAAFDPADSNLDPHLDPADFSRYLTAVWHGRELISGINTNSKIQINGLIFVKNGIFEMVNPIVTTD